MATPTETIGARKLKAARKKKGWSQRQLARLLGCNHSSVSKWESGTRPRPDLPTALKLNDLLQLNPTVWL